MVRYGWDVRCVRTGQVEASGECPGLYQAEAEGQRYHAQYAQDEPYTLELFELRGSLRVPLPESTARRELQARLDSADLSYSIDYGDAAALARVEAKVNAIIDYLLAEETRG